MAKDTKNHMITVLGTALAVALTLAAAQAGATERPLGPSALLGTGLHTPCANEYGSNIVSPLPRDECSDKTVFICTENPEAEICNEPYLTPARAAQVRRDVEFFKKAISSVTKGSRKQ